MEEIKKHVHEKHIIVKQIKDEISKVLIGQDKLVEGLLIGLFTRGHILIEGVPGLAKTCAVKALSQTINADFKRIQFTPDLLPADIIGTEIYEPKTGEFKIKKGPIFHNIILADEINRAPSKVQAALLEAMQERQITIGDATFPLKEPFLVLATQNPIEQEGTYPLPEAQIDRFMLKILISYPSKAEEKEIMKRVAFSKPNSINKIIEAHELEEIFNIIQSIYVDESIKEYIVDIVDATRNPSDYRIDISKYIQYGASPRATIFLSLAARAYAFIQKRPFVTPQDIKTIAPDILRHRIILTYEAEAEDITTDEIINQIFESVPVP
ncbi:MAG: AAA family ATPase [Desulfobacterales bacterium]|nr:AAA family ATPase [Desulfobacterales bacterium]